MYEERHLDITLVIDILLFFQALSLDIPFYFTYIEHEKNKEVTK